MEEIELLLNKDSSLNSFLVSINTSIHTWRRHTQNIEKYRREIDRKKERKVEKLKKT